MAKGTSKGTGGDVVREELTALVVHWARAEMHMRAMNDGEGAELAKAMSRRYARLLDEHESTEVA